MNFLRKILPRIVTAPVAEAMERKRNREKPVAAGKLRSEFLKMEIFRLFLVQNHSKLRFFLADK